MTRILAITLLAGLAAPASAFYFPNWPGSLVPPKPAIVTTYTPGDPPSVQPPVPPETTNNNPGNPSGVPEPGTLIMAGIGLGFAWRKFRRVDESRPDTVQ